MQKELRLTREKEEIYIGLGPNQRDIDRFCGLLIATGNFAKDQPRIVIKTLPGNEAFMKDLASRIGGRVLGPYFYPDKDSANGATRKLVVWNIGGEALRSVMQLIVDNMPVCDRKDKLAEWMNQWENKGEDFKTKSGAYLKIRDDLYSQ